MTKPSSLITNSHHEVPLQHWHQACDDSHTLTPERRSAGYEIFDTRHNTRRTETLDLVNSIRNFFIPDFLIRLANGKMLVLEIKGEDSEQNKVKRTALNFWVQGVNAKGGFGVWCWDVAFVPAQLQDILAKHAC